MEADRRNKIGENTRSFQAPLLPRGFMALYKCIFNSILRLKDKSSKRESQRLLANNEYLPTAFSCTNFLHSSAELIVKLPIAPVQKKTVLGLQWRTKTAWRTVESKFSSLNLETCKACPPMLVRNSVYLEEIL